MTPPPLPTKTRARRLPFRNAQRLEASSDRTFVFESTLVVKMKQDCADVPYVTQKGDVMQWHFSLAYDTMEGFMPLAQEQLAASRLPVDEGEQILKVGGPTPTGGHQPHCRFLGSSEADKPGKEIVDAPWRFPGSQEEPSGSPGGH